MEFLCPCGQSIESSSAANPYTIIHYNEKGDIVYAICVHGHVVINKTTESLEEFNKEK